MFRRTLKGRQKALGQNDEDTLCSFHWRGLSLYHHRNKEAEIMLRRAVKGQQNVRGRDDEETLAFVYWLWSLSMTSSGYDEEEPIPIFSRALKGREKALGPNYEDTLESGHWLAHTLYNQSLY